MARPSDRQWQAVTRALLGWYRRHGRHLPWRNTRNPYRILVAEIMLHQTQVSRVLQIFPTFLRRFPSLHALAAASQAEVLIAWRGLGYNNRAVRIHRLARRLTAAHGGKLPHTLEECLPLPGIGRYTAHALMVSVYRRDLPVVDVNVRRVLSRLSRRMTTTADVRPETEIWNLAATLVPRGRGYDWTQALMDLGATICTARAPRCASCPVAAYCASRCGMKQASPAARRREPSFGGVPVRISRGRIVEMLRSLPAGLTADEIRRKLHDRSPSTQWIAGVLRALEKDGLIALRGDPRLPGTRVLLA